MALAAVSIAVVVGVTACGGPSHSNARSSTSVSGSAAATQSDPSLAALAATTTPSASPTLLSQAGTGIKQTKVFTITAPLWTLAYTYDCSSLGQGDFLAVVHGVAGTPDGVLIKRSVPR